MLAWQGEPIRTPTRATGPPVAARSGTASVRPVGRIEQYRSELRARPEAEWPAFLTAHSGLPGPRANIELARAFAEEATRECVDDVIATDDEYLTFCGVVGLGRLLALSAGPELEQRLHDHARDERWRVREAVAMALQRLGDDDLPGMLRLVTAWSRDDDPLVRRAAVAGVCEPRLLRTPEATRVALDACERATTSVAALPPGARHDAPVRTLRQGLGYCWSVAVAADPGNGLARFAALSASTDPDVAWIVRENRRRTRLARLL